MKKNHIKIIIVMIIAALMITHLTQRYIVVPSKRYEKGIDISEHQGAINWEQLNYNDISFVFIRSSYGTSTDACFFSNYEHAKASDLSIGIYHYLYATTRQEAEAEAEYLLNLIQGYDFDLPIFIDIEDPTLMALDDTLLSDIVLTFLNKLEEKGYEVGYYTNLSFYIKHLSTNELSSYDKWIAQYSDVLFDLPKASFWQYTNEGHIDGIDTDVDYSYMLK